MNVEWKELKEGAIEREDAFMDQCAIHVMQALLSIDPENYNKQEIRRAYDLAWRMSLERRFHNSDWGYIEPEEESTTD